MTIKPKEHVGRATMAIKPELWRKVGTNMPEHNGVWAAAYCQSRPRRRRRSWPKVARATSDSLSQCDEIESEDVGRRTCTLVGKSMQPS
jgi:hypothetical protein